MIFNMVPGPCTIVRAKSKSWCLIWQGFMIFCMYWISFCILLIIHLTWGGLYDHHHLEKKNGSLQSSAPTTPKKLRLQLLRKRPHMHLRVLIWPWHPRKLGEVGVGNP